MTKNADKQKLESQNSLSWSYFIDSIGPEATKETYTFALLDYMKANGYDVSDTDTLVAEDHKTIERKITQYFINLKRIGKLSPHTLMGRYIAIKRFYSMQPDGYSDINWRRISRYYVKNYNGKNRLDIPYTYDQISRLLNVADLRMKVCIFLMCGAGLRRGALTDLTLRSVKDIQYENYNLVQITVYERTDDEYITLGTPELKAEIDNYLSYRQRYGEDLRYNKDTKQWEPGNAPLIREQFDISDVEAVKNPKFVANKTIKTLIHKLLYKSGLRTKPRENRGINSESHSLRKFYRTQLFSAGVDALIAEMLLGHETGLVGVYTKPTLQQQLEQFASKAISKLTINEEERQKLVIEKLEMESEKQQTSFNKALEDMKREQDAKFKQAVDDLYKRLGLPPT